jgi:hypothetical protein
MIIISKYFVPRGYLGIAIFPFVFLKHHSLKAELRFVNHEKIHLKQQLEMLIIPFYFFYTFEFLVRLFQYKNWQLAYQNISFEREAYAKESDLNYLNQRPFWYFLKYLRKHDF